MNRQQFAETCAHAYVAQFSRNGSPVMNQMVIVYDGRSFGGQSSLTPLDDNEVLVLSLELGMFGDDPDTEESIVAFFVDSASDEIWRAVLNTIEAAIVQ